MQGGHSSCYIPGSLLFLLQMDVVKKILLTVAVVALATYGLDCLAMTTPEQAMQCCNSMPCSPNGHHGQDCCKTMPSANAPFLRSPHTSIAPAVHVVGAAILGLADAPVVSGESVRVSMLSHAPPIRYSPASLPIRI
jgi:hypothetical protein